MIGHATPPLGLFCCCTTQPSRRVDIKTMYRAYVEEKVLARTNANPDVVVYEVCTVLHQVYSLYMPACYLQAGGHQTPLTKDLTSRTYFFCIAY